MTILLESSSMAHAIDRAVGFRFLERPYRVLAVRPNAIVLLSPKGELVVVRPFKCDVPDYA